MDRCRFSLHEADPVAAATLVEALARGYGPWILYDADSEKPALVLPGSDPQEIAGEL